MSTSNETVAAATFTATSCVLKDTSAKVRITWQWRKSDTVPAVAQDAYIEGDGSAFVNTGVVPAPDLRVEVDYALTSIVNDTKLFGTYTGSGQNAEYYVNTSGGYSFHVGQGWVGGIYLAMPDLNRHTVVMDIPEGEVRYVTGAETVATVAMKAKPGLAAAGTVPIGLFGRISNASGAVKEGNSATLRIYGAKFYKGGALVKNLVPCVKGGVAGFRDTESGAFHSAEFNVASLSAGGDVETIPDDGFIELAGNDQTKADGERGGHFFDTGYTPNAKTRLAVDFAFANGYNKPQQELFDAGSGLFCRLYTQDSSGVNGKYSMIFNKGWTVAHSGIPVDHQRRLVVFDGPNTTMSMTPGATDGSTYSSSSVSASGATSAHTLVFGSLAVPDETQGYLYAKARLYRLTIYDDGQKVRDYVPTVENGVAGLRDLVHPENEPLTAEGLTVSGLGHEGAEEWIATPAAETNLKRDDSVSFTALAVGAVRYVWTRNGETLVETGDTLSVAGTHGTYGVPDAYTVTPVYDVFGEETLGGTYSFSVTVLPSATVLIVR